MRERLAGVAATTRWLSDQGFPTIVPLAVAEPVVVDGWLATAWHHVTNEMTHDPQPEDLAAHLHRLHTLAQPPHPVRLVNFLGGLRADLNSNHLDRQQQRLAESALRPYRGRDR